MQEVSKNQYSLIAIVISQKVLTDHKHTKAAARAISYNPSSGEWGRTYEPRKLRPMSPIANNLFIFRRRNQVPVMITV